MQNAISVRPASSDEREAVLALWRESAHGASPTDDLASLTRLQSSDGQALLLAVDGDRIIGSIIAGWDGWRGNLYRLAVSPDYRRRGIGARLVRDAEERLCQAGAMRIGAIVERDNERAQEFWAAQGYAVAGSQERYFKDLDRP